MTYITDVPEGYEYAAMTLTNSNEVVLVHESLQPMIYDESVMTWVQMNVAGASHG